MAKGSRREASSAGIGFVFTMGLVYAELRALSLVLLLPLSLSLLSGISSESSPGHRFSPPASAASAPAFFACSSSSTNSMDVVSWRACFFVHKFYGYLTPNVIIVSIAIFSLLTRIEIRKTITKKIFFQLSKLSFGIYLSHMLFLSFLLDIKVNYFTPNGLFDSIVIFFFCFICSMGITWIMKKMPLLKRFV